MKLRSQLLVMSLFLLSLPWAGCQYIIEMERVLLETHERELIASARALALMLADESHIFLGADEASASESIYFHGLSVAPDVDADSADWQQLSIQPVRLRSLDEAASSAHLIAGKYEQSLFLFIDISIPEPQWNRRQPEGVLLGDKIRLYTADGILEIAPFSAGPVFARWQNSSQYRDMASEYRVQGAWNRSADGYHIELQLSPFILGDRLGLEFAPANPETGSQPSHYLGMSRGAPVAYVTASSELDQRLKTFVGEGLKLGVSDRSGWMRGHAGELQLQRRAEGALSSGIVDRLYNWLLESEETGPLDNWRDQGRFQTLDVLSALTGQIRTAVFSAQDLRIYRATVPIERGGEVLGAVIAEKSSASVVEATDTAFGRLAFWVLLATILATVALLTYASLLSLRIRRLSKAAVNAMQDPASGELAESFPKSGAKDEIGELNQSFGQLLSRLDEYTQYLRTLSGKLSHEIRTPLAIIRSSLDNLEQESSDGSLKTYSIRAREGTSRLSTILNAMSSASHLEESVQAYELEPLQLDALLKQAIESYRTAYPDTQFRDAISAVSIQIAGSAELLIQLLDKLVDNALDFCQEKGEIEIGLEQIGEQVRLWVSNDGPLLPENMQQQLFDSLVSVRQGDHGKMEKESGKSTAHLGLGLYMVRLIAEHHGAKVTAKNREDGSGAEFSVLFPC